MSDKISYSRWKAFTKKQKLEGELDDKELLRVLSKFDKTDEGKPAPRLEALEDLIKEIPKQVTALVKLKKKLGDKPFGLAKDELYAILEEAEKLQKKTQEALDAEGDEDEGEEDEDSAPNLLLQPKQLLKQLTMCKKDPERTMKFAFIDGKGKEQPPVLAMHPKLSAKKLFSKLQIATGVKTGAFGSAWIDGTSLMLQLDKPLSGLVKKVRGPVKACGFKIAKAVLWNADGTVFEQDELPDEAVGDVAVQAAPGAPVDGGNNSTNAPPQPSVTYERKLAELLPRVEKAAGKDSADAGKYQKLLAFAAGKAANKDYLVAVAALKQVEQLLDKQPEASGGASVDAGGAFKARLTALLPALTTAWKEGRPGALEAKAKATEAGMVAGKRDFVRADALLDEVQQMLDSSPSETQLSSPRSGTPQAPGGAVDYAKSRLAWVDAKATLRSDLQALKTAILARYNGTRAYGEIEAKIGQFDRVLTDFADDLSAMLDDALNATEPTDRQRHHAAAAQLIGEYLAKAQSDPFITRLEANPFVAFQARAVLVQTLGVLSRQIA